MVLKIVFEFLKDGRKCTSFPFGINFTGWRAAWVCYERDMEGSPEEGMNEIRIIAPDVKGNLYLDHIIPASKVDARQQTADVQVPFVNKGTTNHWLVLYERSLLKPDLELIPINEKQKLDMHLIEQRFKDMLYVPSWLTETELANIRREYDSYQIVYHQELAYYIAKLIMPWTWCHIVNKHEGRVAYCHHYE